MSAAPGHPAESVREFHDCPRCGWRVGWRDILGGAMLCDATIVVVGNESRDWGTSGPHFCRPQSGEAEALVALQAIVDSPAMTALIDGPKEAR